MQAARRRPGAAILIDATIIRAVLLPATMKLLGERNWWLPKRLAWLPKFAHEPEVMPAPPDRHPLSCEHTAPASTAGAARQSSGRPSFSRRARPPLATTLRAWRRCCAGRLDVFSLRNRSAGHLRFVSAVGDEIIETFAPGARRPSPPGAALARPGLPSRPSLRRSRRTSERSRTCPTASSSGRTSSTTPRSTCARRWGHGPGGDPYRAGVTTDGAPQQVSQHVLGPGCLSPPCGGCDIHAAFDSPTGLSTRRWRRATVAAPELRGARGAVDTATGKAKGVPSSTASPASATRQGQGRHARGLHSGVDATDDALEVPAVRERDRQQERARRP